jgi:hypothetical protein
MPGAGVYTLVWQAGEKSALVTCSYISGNFLTRMEALPGAPYIPYKYTHNQENIVGITVISGHFKQKSHRKLV